MLVTLKDTTFDEDDYCYLYIGGHRYLTYSEDSDDYFIWNDPEQPVLIRGKPIQVVAPIGGSVEEIRAFAVDRPNSVDFLLVGVLFRSPANGFTWIAGNFVGDDLHVGVKEEILKDGNNKDWLLLPPLLFRYPKVKPSNMSKNQLLAKIAAETEIRTHHRLRHFGLPDPEKLELHRFIHPDSLRDEDEQVEGHNMEVEAHNLNSSNVLSMEQLNSSLDKHATTCNCSRCQTLHLHRCFISLLLHDKQKVKSKARDEDEDEQVEGHNMEVEAHNLNSSNVWSMEQLNSSLGKCATGNCSHCRGVILE